MWKGYVSEVYVDRYIAKAADANGNAVGAIGPCPEGHCWYVERNTCYSNTAQASPLLELYVLRSGAIAPTDTFTKAGRQDVASGVTVKNAVSDQAAPIYIGPGYSLVAVWSGLAQSDLVALSVQIRVHRLEPMVDPPVRHHGVEDSMDEHLAHATPVITPDQVAAI